MSLVDSETTGTKGIAGAWDRYAVAYQNAARITTDVVSYGPGVGTEQDFRLLGSLTGKRVLDLGCGGGQSLIAFVKSGAIAIGVDISVEQLAYARRLIEQEEVRVELKHGDLAELAFQRADSVDVAFSAYAFQYVPDLNRVFRQVHRILKNNGIFVFSMPHPASAMTGQMSTVVHKSNQQLSLDSSVEKLTRSYFDNSPMEDRYENLVFTEYRHTIADIYMGLVRSGYRVDVVAEPQVESTSFAPQTLIVRARKES